MLLSDFVAGNVSFINYLNDCSNLIMLLKSFFDVFQIPRLTSMSEGFCVSLLLLDV